MSKLRVHDLAGEFGISADEVIALLRQMDVPVRTHMSMLTDDQVSRARARWEREKRVRADKAQPAAAAPSRRRRSVAATTESAPGPVEEVEAPAPTIRRRRAKDVAAARAVEDAAAAEAANAEAAEAAAAAESAAAKAAEAKAVSDREGEKAKVRAAAKAEKEAAAASEAVLEKVAPSAQVPLDAAKTDAAEAAPASVEADAGESSSESEVDASQAASRSGRSKRTRSGAQPVDGGEAGRDVEPDAKADSHTGQVSDAPAMEVATKAESRAQLDSADSAPSETTVSAEGARTPDEAASRSVDGGAESSEPTDNAAAEKPDTTPTAASLPPDRPRPRPVVPGAPRLRPVASGSPNFGSARPVASAAPGGGLSQGQRRDDRRPAASTSPGQGGGPSTTQPGMGAPTRRGKKGKRGAVDQEAVSANITKTMTALRGQASRGRGGRGFGREVREEMEAQRSAAAERERKTVRVNEFITVSELAQTLGISATQIVGFAFKTLGLMVTINQRLDFDQIELISSEFGFQAVKESDYAADMTETEPEDDPADLRPRPPVVTIMGHVDHGKTSLLDYIRKENVVAGEAGGITQHIGAYHVKVGNGKQITFLDTPGHEAFTAMRARGAQVTDIVVIVIAADDQVMPQTIEAISHAKSAGVPIIIAINKIDLETANVTKAKQDLLQHDVVLEEFGGTVLHSEISAKKGTNVPALLDQILLQAELLELQANPDRRATGSVVEAQLDQGKGPVATVLVQNGTLKVGDDFIVGIHSGRVRALLDERGRQVKFATPAIPVQILGVNGVPMAGDQLLVVEDAGAARDIAQRRERLDREAKSRRTTRGIVSLEDFMSQTAAGEKQELRLVIKADQGGPAEALADALGQLSNNEVTVEILHRGVGAIAETDILLAKASGAIIIGFHVRPDTNARAAAEREGVEIRLYRIIYEAVAEIKAALEKMLRPESREVVFGEAEVRETFKVARVGTIAGCIVRSGTINRKGRVRVVRDSIEVYDGVLSSLRRFKDDVNEVKEGYECGIGIENFNDLKVGDIFEFYRTEEVARTLEQASKA